MLSRESARRIARLSRRARAIAVLDGAADAGLVGGLAGGSLLLLLRLAGVTLAPLFAWVLGGAVVAGALAWGLLVMRRRTPRAGGCAAWLDRRMSLGGLLVVSTEIDASAWEPVLARALARGEVELPRLPLRRSAPRLLLPLAFLAAVALLPAAKLTPSVDNPAIADALAVEQGQLDLLEERRALQPEAAEELQARLDALEARLEQHEPVSWSDVDALSAQREAALALRLDAIEQAGDALAELGVAGAGTAELGARVEQALRSLEAAGLLGELPPDLLERLGLPSAPGEGGLDPAALTKLAGLDAAALESLARDLQGALAQRFDGLAQAGLADAEAGRRLAELSAAEWANAQDGEPGHQHDGECAGGKCKGAAGLNALLAGSKPGRGGISRGRADAELRYTGETQQSAESFEAERLPSTAPLSLEWTTTGVGRAEPDAAPIESNAAGGAGQAGDGAAAWQRRLAPRHRDVVKRFFEPAR